MTSIVLDSTMALAAQANRGAAIHIPHGAFATAAAAYNLLSIKARSVGSAAISAKDGEVGLDGRQNARLAA